MSAGGAAAIWRLAPATGSDDADADRKRDSCSSAVAAAASHRPLYSSSPVDLTPRTGASAAATAAGLEDSPTRRRNKRKMTEPRRRATDFSIRSICSSSNSDVDDDDDDRGAETGAVRIADSPAKIWKPNDVLDAPARPPTMLPTPIGAGFGFYPLSIPLVYPSAYHAAVAAAGIVPTPPPSSRLRSASVDSSAGSSGGEQDRSAMVNDDTNSSSAPGNAADLRPTPSRFDRESPPVFSPMPPPSATASALPGPGGGRAASPRKNYKNMTKQRRIEANARERTRVHTISAAFESLRRAVPSYSYNQRLSKLAILRIACSYILALARLADLDYSTPSSVSAASSASSAAANKQLSFAECVDLCTQTIQAEGRAKRRH